MVPFRVKQMIKSHMLFYGFRPVFHQWTLTLALTLSLLTIDCKCTMLTKLAASATLSSKYGHFWLQISNMQIRDSDRQIKHSRLFANQRVTSRQLHPYFFLTSVQITKYQINIVYPADRIYAQVICRLQSYMFSLRKIILSFSYN